MKRLGIFAFALAMAFLPFAGAAPSIEPRLLIKAAAIGQAKDGKHPRGHVTPKDLKERIAKSWQRHGKQLQRLPKVSAPTWDCRTLGILGPIEDQGNCGSCWLVSATSSVLQSSFIKAGWFNTSGDQNNQLAAQYVMDGCGP